MKGEVAMMNEAASEKVIELLVQQKRELRIQRDQLIESIRERQIERDEARGLARQYLNDLHALGRRTEVDWLPWEV